MSLTQLLIAHGLALAVSTSAILSVVTFVVYGVDKRAARRGTSRIAERVLHLLAALGGWPGAYVGQRVFRHKTQKQPFRRVFWLTLVPPLAVLAILAFLALR